MGWLPISSQYTHDTQTEAVLVQKVLFGLFVAIVVAITEASLYLIWQSRRSKSAERKVKRRRLPDARHKKEEEPQDASDTIDETNSTPIATGTDEGAEKLRRRH
jgi:MFS superfamily sulfate permease-like transporter